MMDSCLIIWKDEDLMWESEEAMKKGEENMIPWSTYNSEEIKAVWDKAEYIEGVILYRKDCYGYTITDSEYMNERSVFGWFIDHIIPLSSGGTETIENLIPVSVYNYGKDHRTHLEKIFCKA